MTDHEEHREGAPASATDPRSDAELDAIAEAEVEGLPVSTDAYDGALMLVRLAHVYTDVGETDRAIEVLEQAAALPAGPAYGLLQLDGEFDPLRADSRFQKIVASVAPQKR